MLTDIVDQKRIERTEEQAGVMVDALERLTAMAHAVAQFAQHQIAAGNLFVAHQAALERTNQHRVRLRRQLAQILA